jgi:hypothetical protein
MNQSYLKKLIKYHPHSGYFNWISNDKCQRRVGTSHGNIIIESKLYRKTKLAWLYMTGVYPVDPVIFIDGCKQNFKFVNLSSQETSSSDKIKIKINRYKNKGYKIFINDNDMGVYCDIDDTFEVLKTCLKLMISK